jgi:hypothetical protein
MDEDLNVKIIVGLVSVIVGLFLGQIISGIKGVILRRKIKKALLTELMDIRIELGRVEQSFLRSLQLVALKCTEGSIPQKLSNFIFTENYKNIALHLNQEQRISYQMIHGYVATVNADIEKLEKLISDVEHAVILEEQPAKTSYFKTYSMKIQQAYMNACVTHWHIDHHLKNKKYPVLKEEGEQYEAYEKLQDDINEYIKNTIKKAEKMKLSDFGITVS